MRGNIWQFGFCCLLLEYHYLLDWLQIQVEIMVGQQDITKVSRGGVKVSAVVTPRIFWHELENTSA